jgi:alkaline phosphatase D
VEWDQDANMIDSFCNRALGRMTRRELLNIAWKLGAVAIAQPIVSSRVLAQPLYRSYPFSLGVASGDPWQDSVVLWTRLAPDPLEGGGMPMSNVDVGWEIASDRTFRTVTQKGTSSPGRSSGTACASRSAASIPDTSTGIASTPGTR